LSTHIAPPDSECAPALLALQFVPASSLYD